MIVWGVLGPGPRKQDPRPWTRDPGPRNLIHGSWGGMFSGGGGGHYSGGQKVCTVLLDADTTMFVPYSPRILQNTAQNLAFYHIFTAPGAVLALFASIQQDLFQFLVSVIQPVRQSSDQDPTGCPWDGLQNCIVHCVSMHFHSSLLDSERVLWFRPGSSPSE